MKDILGNNLTVKLSHKHSIGVHQHERSQMVIEMEWN